MDKDWIKAVTLLCVIAQNNADSMKRSVRYVEIMKKEYGLDAEKFQRIYDSWFRSGEIQEKYRILSFTTRLYCIGRGEKSAERRDAYCFEEMDSVSILYVERKQYPGRVIFREFLHIYK